MEGFITIWFLIYMLINIASMLMNSLFHYLQFSFEKEYHFFFVILLYLYFDIVFQMFEIILRKCG